MKTQPTLRRHLCPFILLILLVLLAAYGLAKTALPTATSPPTETPLPKPAPTRTPRPDRTATAPTPTSLSPTLTPTSLPSTPTFLPPTPTSALPSPEAAQEPRSTIWGDFEIRMIPHPQDSSKTDVYVKNLKTGEQKLCITLSDVYVKHYHNSEYHNVNLYVIRRIGYDGYPDEEWTDELWKYDTHGKGARLYSAQGLDFRVAPDERYVAIERDHEKLIFLDPLGNSAREFTVGQLSGHDRRVHFPMPAYLFLLQWSDDSSEFWGEVAAGPSPQTFYRVNVASWQATTYDVSRLAIPWEYDLNANTGKLAYSDLPAIYTVDDREDFIKSQQQVTLFVYDFSDQSTQTIATSVAKGFDPKWLDDRTIEYNNPDGDDRIVYVMSSLGKLAYVQGGDIWVKALPDGDPQRLTTDSRNSQPRWSSSGEWLAFRKGEFKQVWVMRADGSDARSLMAVPDGAFAWSPVADRLAYADGDRLKVVNANGTDPATLVAGLSVTPPTPPPRKENTVFHIAWNPDGTWIAYEWMERHIDQGLVYQGLWKVLAEDGKPVELYASGVPEKGDAILAGWSLDNQHILFWQGYMLSASMLADGVAFYSLPANGGEPTKLVDAVLVHDDFFAPAPQGDRLAVTAGGSRATWTNKRVAVVGVASGELTWLTDESVAAFSPAWSPDGIHLAYVAMPDRGDLVGGEDARLGMMERRIWVVNTQGTPQLQQLTDDPAYRDERPLWSADGSHLLFARMDAGGRASLWLIPAGGGDTRQVVDELTPLPDPASGWFGYYGHVEWDSLFDWWRGPAVPEVSLSPRDQLSAEILDALAAYQPVMDAQPTVTTLLSNIARWLNTGGTPSDLAAVLNEASDRTEGAMTVTELDLTGDGWDEVVIHIPVMGLLLLVFLNSGGSPAHFEGHALPLDFETIQHGRPVDLSLETHGIEQPSLQLTDLTGDGVPEVLLNYVFAGGSNFRLHPQAFQWHESSFRLIFAAELVSWIGYSTMTLEPNPVGGQDIVLRYPYFYTTGFEAKMIAHPWATQRWRWDPSLERYALQETSYDPKSVLADGGDVSEWELLRVLVNGAELLYQASDLEGALAGYQDVITRTADMERPEERAPHWPAYARFRIAQVQALLGQARAAQAELSALLADLDKESNLRPLVQAFDEAYDPTQPDAALRAMAALHGLRLYEQFYWHDDRPGDLTFPMSMGPLLWPGTPLAHYLDAHPEAVDGPPSLEREQALLHALSDLGFPVTGVRIADLNADGLAEVLVTTDETDQQNGPRCTWLLAQTTDRWRNYRLPSTPIDQPLPGGRIALRWRDFTSEKELTFLWTGKTLIEVEPETYEPLPPAWPVVGW